MAYGIVIQVCLQGSVSLARMEKGPYQVPRFSRDEDARNMAHEFGGL